MFGFVRYELNSDLSALNQRLAKKVRCNYIQTTLNFSADYGVATIEKNGYSVGNDYRLTSILPYYTFDMIFYNVSFFYRESDNAIIVKCPELKGKTLAASFLTTFLKED